MALDCLAGASNAFCADCGFDSCLCQGAMVKPHEFPRYSRSQYDKAAGRFKKDIPVGSDAARDQWFQAFEIVENWRAAHGYPLGRFREWLLQRATKIDPKVNVAQRLKRLRSIHTKMTRPGRSWRLTQMQDIAGCRAIVHSIPHVQALAKGLRQARTQHRLVGEDDYITNPQATGYRSHHLIFEFCSRTHTLFEGMFCEIQLRTPYQHAWATAVEVAGFFKGQDLKGGQGDKDWLRFFALASGAIAFTEKAPLVPGVPDDQEELLKELIELTQSLGVLKWMSGFRYAPTIATQRAKKDAYWYLLRLDINTRMVTWDSFTIEETELANEHYAEGEKLSVDQPNVQTVLVSADGMRALRYAYPSFFGDSAEFNEMLKMLLGLPPGFAG